MSAEKTVPTNIEGKIPEREKTRGEERYLAPPVDIFETNEGLTLIADLPGVEKEGIEVGLDNDILTMKGTVKDIPHGRPVFSEYELLNFYRQFQITEGIDVEKITANLKNGILTIHLPKAEALKPKKIPITLS